MTKGIIKKLFALAIVLLVVILGMFLWLRSEMQRKYDHQATEKVITISARTSTKGIVAQLHHEGVLRSEWPSIWWLRLFGSGRKLKNGDYQFDSPISPLEIIGKLERGEVATHKLTIPEGLNQWEIAERLAEELPGMKEKAPSQESILSLFKRVQLISDLDSEAKDLEGYLFPDTYEYTASTTRAQLVELMVKRFRKVYNADLQQKGAALGFNTRQVVTMASMVEKEAQVPGDRVLISQVYYKRLKLGMALGCDPTVIYASILAGKYKWNGTIYRSDLDRESPYNTYKHGGMPPGPIASPGKASIEAAVNPASTNYLYFVRDGAKNDGSHVFSESAAQHDKAVAVYRRSQK